MDDLGGLAAIAELGGQFQAEVCRVVAGEFDGAGVEGEGIDDARTGDLVRCVGLALVGTVERWHWSEPSARMFLEPPSGRLQVKQGGPPAGRARSVTGKNGPGPGAGGMGGPVWACGVSPRPPGPDQWALARPGPVGSRGPRRCVSSASHPRDEAQHSAGLRVLQVLFRRSCGETWRPGPQGQAGVGVRR